MSDPITEFERIYMNKISNLEEKQHLLTDSEYTALAIYKEVLENMRLCGL
jgi:hypothetical protein